MKGLNELLLNHATMVEAVQLWVDSEMKRDVKVESVKEVVPGPDQDRRTFNIVLISKEEM